MTKQQHWHGPAHYQIKVKGCLGSQWSDWFEGIAIESEGGKTTIKGEVADQAVLHGLLIRIRDLGLPLISVKRIEQTKNQIRRNSMKEFITSQFGLPRGLTGKLVGWIMAVENRKRNEWAVQQMNVKPDDNVLEIGFGPGVAIQEIARRATNGFVAGVDPSAVMVKQARKRNAVAIQNGKVELKQSSISTIPYKDNTFDKILLVNSLHHCPNPIENLKKVRYVLKPGGSVVIVEQPHSSTKSKEDVVHSTGVKLNNLLKNTGFTNISTQIKPMKPNASVCVTAWK
jgi:2-polyprenyl-3-methyl-5-hydroxy-6-metoxy-1,4-benzoquinol methylase